MSHTSFVEAPTVFFCHRFTPSCGTLSTTTPVFGPGSVSGTRGHGLRHYGYLKGKVTAFKNKSHEYIVCFSFMLYLNHLSLQSCWEREFWSCCEARDRLFIQRRTWVKLHNCLLVHVSINLTRTSWLIDQMAILMISTSDYSFWPGPCFCPPALLSDEGRADVCGRKASHFFSLAESLRSPLADPFIWVFIRPPWSPTGSCCKAVVFDRLKAECDSNVVGFGAANVILL